MKNDYYFINENIINEVRSEESKEKGHLIFNSQRESDMGRLKELLIDENKIFIQFDYEEWGPVMSMIYSIENVQKHIIAGRQYIALKILQALEEKYPQLMQYHGSENINLFNQGNLELYEKNDKLLWSIEDVFEILSFEEINIDRIHFIIRSIGSPVLLNSLTILLSDNTPFKVSFYASEVSFPSCDLHSQKKVWYSDIYSYTSFNKGENGMQSNRLISYQRSKKKITRSS